MKDLKIPNTVFNLIFSLIVIIAGYVLGKYVMPFEDYQFEKTITSIICSIEFISILKKAVLTTNSKAYKYISQYFKIKQPLLNNI